MKCPNCNGGKLLCPVCNGTRKDPRNSNKKCGHCEDGYIECTVCYGKGTVPDTHANL